jgi:hypothetical protein
VQSPLINYLLGIVQKQLTKTEEAKASLLAALIQMPCLWSAWLELAPLFEKKDRAPQLSPALE